jgi:protein-S-isoprenylcysteine O-methyltransferase Ste14
MQDVRSRARLWPFALDARTLKWIAASFSAFLVARILAIAAADGINGALLSLLLTEGVTLALILRARPPIAQSVSPKAVVLTLIPCAVLPLVKLSEGVMLIPQPVPFTLAVLALALQLHAKLTLGRSFGLLPANRQVVDRGPYAVVRHPIYLSYVLQHLGFLLALFSWQNLLVFSIVHVVQWFRLLEEEAILLRDERYRAYAANVRCRIVPYLL